MKTTGNLRALLLAGLIGANALLLALATHTLLTSRQQHLERAELQTQNVAAALDQTLGNSIDKVELALRVVVDEIERQLATGRALDEARLGGLTARLQGRLPEVEAFRVADASGTVVFGPGVSKAQPVSWADRDYFIHHQSHADRELQIAKPRMGRVSKRHIVGFSLRYNRPDGSFGGVVSAPVTLDYFTNLLMGFDLGKRGTLILRDHDLGLVTRFPPITHGDAGQVGNNSVSGELRAVVASGTKLATYYTPAGSDGMKRILTLRDLSRAPMYVLAGVAVDDFLADWREELYGTGALVILFVVVSLALGIVSYRLLRNAERKQAELADREAQLRTLIETVPDMVLFKDAASRWLIANPVCLSLFDLEGEDWCGLTDEDIARRRPHLAAALRACGESDELAWRSGTKQRVEECVPDVSGHFRYLDVYKLPAFDAEGRRHGMLVVGRDITERKLSEAELESYRHNLEELIHQRTEALRESEAWANRILTSSADGLYGVDARGIITFINPAGCRLLGYASAQQVAGRNAHALLHHTRADGSPYPESECHSHNALIEGKTIRVDNEVYWHADGHPIPVMYATHPIVQDGNVIGAVTSFVDVSTQRAAAEARDRALLAAEHLARVRREFLANMSHEIRTPLNGVLGFAEIGARHVDEPARVADAFNRILYSGRRLLGVVNDVLDFSKIEAGRLTIEQGEMALGEVVHHAIDLVRQRAADKQLLVYVDIDPDLPAHCMGDPLRLGQVLLNLLSNAVKFTETGSIRLAVRLQGDRLVFSVSDTGIGLSQSQIGDLFHAFHQVDASATRRFGGTGLGLVISKRLLELMGGEIRVSSRLGEGSVFEFDLPYRPVSGQPRLPAAPAPVVNGARPLAGMSILVAEDEPVNQAMLEENLREDGADVTVVGTGKAALEQVLQNGPDAYDVVLMDLQMPEMDGYEAARRILELVPDLPIIAQTAHAFCEEREKCIEAGMIGHVTKPIDPDALRDALLALPVRAVGD